jgi:hypothetical protein
MDVLDKIDHIINIFGFNVNDPNIILEQKSGQHIFYLKVFHLRILAIKFVHIYKSNNYIPCVTEYSHFSKSTAQCNICVDILNTFIFLSILFE